MPSTNGNVGIIGAGRIGPAMARTASRGGRTAVIFFLGARPCTEWLDETFARDDDGFILTWHAVGRDGLLETSVCAVYAAGHVRSNSTKRCAAAVGEGAMAVQFVHAHTNRQRTEVRTS